MDSIRGKWLAVKLPMPVSFPAIRASRRIRRGCRIVRRPRTCFQRRSPMLCSICLYLVFSCTSKRFRPRLSPPIAPISEPPPSNAVKASRVSRITCSACSLLFFPQSIALPEPPCCFRRLYTSVRPDNSRRLLRAREYASNRRGIPGGVRTRGE